jgi:hypothetical protein
MHFLMNLSGYFVANINGKRGRLESEPQAIRSDVFNVAAPIAP